MLTITQFNNQDIDTIADNKKNIKAYLIIYLKLFTPLSFLLGLTGFAKKGFGYWPTTVGVLLFFFVIIVYLVIKETILYGRDLKNQLKYAGTMTVLKKSRKRNDCFVYTDSKELKKIDVHFFEIFDHIEVGDELYIEAAKSSKYIFKLAKGNIQFINGHNEIPDEKL